MAMHAGETRFGGGACALALAAVGSARYSSPSGTLYPSTMEMSMKFWSDETPAARLNSASVAGGFPFGVL